MESINNSTEADNLITKSQILSECKPYFEAIHNAPMKYVLYRGVKKNGDTISINKTWSHRTPVEMSLKVSDYVDDYFERKFGIRFRKSHSAFCISDISIAEKFGFPHVFLPIGEFKFSWSPIVDDMNRYMERLQIKKDDEVGAIEAINQSDVLSTYKNENLIGAIESLNEVMVHCQSYYLVPVKIMQGMF